MKSIVSCFHNEGNKVKYPFKNMKENIYVLIFEQKRSIIFKLMVFLPKAVKYG